MNKEIKNIIILLGPPGCGKGTQGKMLAPLLSYNYFSMGSTLRAYVGLKEKLSKQVKEVIEKGIIIPDDWIREIILEQFEKLPSADGLVLDGFPRDIHQVHVLDEIIVQFKVNRVKVLYIDVPKFKLLSRLGRREGIESRVDDDPVVIERRFEEYELKTSPLVSYFEKQHRLIRINGDQTIEQVHEEIKRKTLT